MGILSLTNLIAGSDLEVAAVNDIYEEIERWLNGVTASADITITGAMTANSFAGALTGNVTGALTGNVTGNVTGTAATVTGAAQTNITSLGTLTSLTTAGNVEVGGDISVTSSSSDIQEIVIEGKYFTGGIYKKINGTQNQLTIYPQAVAGNWGSKVILAGNRNAGSQIDILSAYTNNLSGTSFVDIVGDLDVTGNVEVGGIIDASAYVDGNKIGPLSIDYTSGGNPDLSGSTGLNLFGAVLVANGGSIGAQSGMTHPFRLAHNRAGMSLALQTSAVHGTPIDGLVVDGAQNVSIPNGDLDVTGDVEVGGQLGIGVAPSSYSLKGTNIHLVGASSSSLLYSQYNSSTTGVFYGADSVANSFTIKQGNNSSTIMSGNSANVAFAGTVTVGAYTLPATDGTNGQVLMTNGSGVLTWTTP